MNAQMNPRSFAAYLDATNLKLDADDADLRTLCAEASEAGCAAVCVYPGSLARCHDFLHQTSSDVNLCAVIGFPHGRTGTGVKRSELLYAAQNGADEVDIVLNHAELRAGRRGNVDEELRGLCQTAREHRLRTKIIVETCYLGEDDKRTALELCETAGADFIKTSTGFGSGGATPDDVRLFAALRTGGIRIKASGGIRTLEAALALIDAGADRLGVSAAGPLLAELRKRGY